MRPVGKNHYLQASSSLQIYLLAHPFHSICARQHLQYPSNLKQYLPPRDGTRHMDALVAANSIDVPTAIVQQEAETLKKQTEVQTPGSDLTIDAFMEDAKRRVQLGMILAEVAKTSELQIDADMIKQRVEEMAKDYDDPDEFVNYYMGNQELLSGIQTLVMEDKVVDWIAEQASISTKNSTFDEVMNPEADKSR